MKYNNPLPPEIRAKIKKLYNEGETQIEIAKKLGIAQATVSKVIHGGETAKVAPGGARAGTHKPNSTEKQEIAFAKKLSAAGKTQQEIAEIMGTSQQMVSKMLKL